MKRYKNIEFSKNDSKICERLKRFLKENGIYYECSAVDGWGYHLEILCDSNDEKMANDFLDKIYAE